MKKINPFKIEVVPLKGNRLRTDSHDFYYETAQNSPTVKKTFVISHGACASGRYMNIVALKILSDIENSKVIVIDLPFHGLSKTDIDVKGLNVHDYKDHLKELVNFLNDVEVEGELCWIGWSMGGSLGLLLEIEQNIMDNLILVNSAPYWESVNSLLSLPPFQDENVAKPVFKTVVQSELKNESEEIQKGLDEEYEKITSSGRVIINDLTGLLPEFYDVRNELHKVKAKTLIFSGTQDNLALPELQDLMKKEIPNATLKMIDFGHCPVLSKEKTHELVQFIKENL